jgi:RsiW-degrading membrane proteinase PrsW (M82 family)
VHASWKLAASGAIPALIAMVIIDRLDAKRPEPLRTRWLVAFVGMLSVIPAVALEVGLSRTLGEHLPPSITYQGATFQAFAVAAAIEEACKISVIYWVVWRRPEFDERMDGIVYGSRAGLGFALVENVMYLFGQASLGGQIETWIMRAVLAVPGHAMWSGMVGAMAARRRFDGKGLGLPGGYLLAVSFHGLYDMTAFVQRPLALEGHETLSKLTIPALALLTIIAFFTLRSMARKALELDDIDAAKAAAHVPTDAAKAAAHVPSGTGAPAG